MKQYIILSCILLGALFYSCSDDHKPAQKHLAHARTYLAEQEFDKAKAEIDSINTLYPKSFEQRKAAVPLLDSIRKAENLFIIAQVDSQLVTLESEVENLKKDFLFQKDAKYQDLGTYVPKSTGGTGVLSYTTLLSGVEESGRLFLKSIYIGAQRHNKIKVSNGNEEVESLEIQGDGSIYRFSDLGQNYETITLSDTHDNGVARFIVENIDKNLKVTLGGMNTNSYTLPLNIKKAIAQSYELSTQILLIDSLKTEKEKAEYKNFYLDNGRRTDVPIEEKDSATIMKE